MKPLNEDKFYTENYESLKWFAVRIEWGDIYSYSATIKPTTDESYPTIEDWMIEHDLGNFSFVCGICESRLGTCKCKSKYENENE